MNQVDQTAGVEHDLNPRGARRANDARRARAVAFARPMSFTVAGLARIDDQPKAVELRSVGDFAHDVGISAPAAPPAAALAAACSFTSSRLTSCCSRRCTTG